jgi:ATP-dependent DNA helicase RecQ
MPLRRRLLESNSTQPALLAHKWNLFLELMRWAEGGSCRHDAILRYFGDEAETLDGCGRCDVCETLDERAELTSRSGGEPEANPPRAEGARINEAAPNTPDPTLTVRKALSAVARVHKRFGLQAAVRLLRGEADPRLEREGLDRTPTFGTLREHGEHWLTRLLRRCVTAGWVDFTGDERPLVMLTPAGRAVMKGERPVRLLLPREGDGKAAPRSGPLRKAASPERPLDESGGALFEALRAHRLRLARDQGVPPYVVASDRTLRELALLRPRTVGELMQVYGIGQAKADRYGDGFLGVIAAHKAPATTP